MPVGEPLNLRKSQLAILPGDPLQHFRISFIARRRCAVLNSGDANKQVTAGIAKGVPMTLVDDIRHQIGMTHWGGAEAFADLTDEQFNWAPSRANLIAVTLLHAYGIEDAFIQGKLLDQPQLWDSGGWATKVGVAEIPDLGNGWAGMREVTLAKEPILAYGQAV